jgi:hypothetical protein
MHHTREKEECVNNFSQLTLENLVVSEMDYTTIESGPTKIWCE